MKMHNMTKNIGLKIMAFLFAVLLWVIVVNVDDPVVSAVYRDIPITVINDDVVTNKGKVYQIVDDVQKVNVTVHAKRSLISKISGESISATADLSQMDVNTYMVPITATVKGYEANIQSVDTNPRNIEVNIQDVTGKKFPISVSTSGTPRDGYVVGEMTTNPKEVTLRGSETLIDSIEKVVAKIDISGMSDSGVVDAELICYDSNGNVVDQTKLSNNLGDKGISVNVQMLNTKNVGLNFAVSGEPKAGYIYTGMTVEPESVQICGTEDVLAEIDSINIPADQIDITNEHGKKEYTIDITPFLPKEVSLVDETANNVVVTILIEQEGTKTIELPVESIQVKNLSDKFKVSFEAEKDLVLTFTGLEQELATLDIKNAASIDLKNYTAEGEYDVPVTIETATGVTLTEQPSVRIMLKEKTDVSDQSGVEKSSSIDNKTTDSSKKD